MAFEYFLTAVALFAIALVFNRIYEHCSDDDKPWGYQSNIDRKRDDAERHNARYRKLSKRERALWYRFWVKARAFGELIVTRCSR